MREVFLAELVKEVLGPRTGIDDPLQDSPLSEYITGVLAPTWAGTESDIESDPDLPQEQSESYEDDVSERNVDVPPNFSPALSPRNKPPTMGLSFVVEGEENASLQVCLTWARYGTTIVNGRTNWVRRPRHSILSVRLDNRVIWLDSGGHETTPNEAEASLHISIRTEQNRHLIHLLLVNRIGPPPVDNRATVEHHIFQPQIRVVPINSRIVPNLGKVQESAEERSLDFLYRNRPVLARGHLCSATWRQIDPENPENRRSDFGIDFPERLSEPPFFWVDGELLQPEERAIFSPPEVRTEFVPIYLILSPELFLDNPRVGELWADELAEMWDRDRLQAALVPLAQEYERWIIERENEANSLPQNEQAVALNLMRGCRTVLQRIRTGIERLYNNDDARLAFCFANQASDLSYRWSHDGERLLWYPFQIGFILTTIESIVNPRSQYRNTCDLLWVPTGAGKTEAYLALTAFNLAYRRRRAARRNLPEVDTTGAGVSVITRYTLRLLTIQQFRRALVLIVACDYLRVENLLTGHRIGWRPTACQWNDNFIWGSTQFSAGLWVGGEVTPNRLDERWVAGRPPVPGAIGILQGIPSEDGGEPAQVLNCPRCGAILAVPERGLQAGLISFHFVISYAGTTDLTQAVAQLAGRTFHDRRILTSYITPHAAGGYFTLSLEIQTITELTTDDVNNLWGTINDYFVSNAINIRRESASAARPGYFIRSYLTDGTEPKEYDFEIYCPNPRCGLHRDWCAGLPSGWIQGAYPSIQGLQRVGAIALNDNNRLSHVIEPFRNGSPFVSDRVPVPALTVDEQIYKRLPSLVVATVDKFARPPFEPRAASLFGNVEFHNCVSGYYRTHDHHPHSSDGHAPPTGRHNARNFKAVRRLEPPDLILQDELHLIEGPLGSLVGFYETAFDFLCLQDRAFSAKYVSATATIRRAEEQVSAVFQRDLQVFPPLAFTAEDRFFVREQEADYVNDSRRGRLYVGICAPGRGPHMPTVRIWSKLLQTAWSNRTHPNIDNYWTLTGYFNAVRELGGALALYRQDIILRVNERSISHGDARPLTEDMVVELSRRSSSTDLPVILDLLSRPAPSSPDALFTTSMFGTGVDIRRIGLMVVNGQPKTTSAYIQSTGRVGRNRGALVVTFYRASRPRDLSHYEFFCGYHRQLHRYVEPITVYPFAPGVLARAAGPVSVYILRNMRNAIVQWRDPDSAAQMATSRTRAQEVLDIPRMFETRAQHQPRFRRPTPRSVERLLSTEIDRWHSYASNLPNITYVEYAIDRDPELPVVLGDSPHEGFGLAVVYPNAPRSLREIEDTTGFQEE